MDCAKEGMLIHYTNPLKIVRLTHRYSQFDDTTLSYLKLDNLFLATQMQASLPQELRDLVRSYIWDIEHLKLTLRRIVRSLQGMDYEFFGIKSHVIIPEYVGPDMARKAMKAYYRCASGMVDAFAAHCPDSIENVLFLDVFKLGLKPVEYLRALTVQINGTCKDGVDDMKLEEIKNNLAQLFQIVRKKDFKLEIILQQTHILLRQWNELFSILGPFSSEFEATGVKDHLSWAYVDQFFRTEKGLRSIDDVFRQWHPRLNCNPDIVAWLDRQAILSGGDRKYEIEDDEGHAGHAGHTE
jgi:hypothetical protein